MAYIEYDDVINGRAHASLDDAALDSVVSMVKDHSNNGPLDIELLKMQGLWPINFELVCLFSHYLDSRGLEYHIKVIRHDIEKNYDLNGEDGEVYSEINKVSECRFYYDDPEGIIYSQFLLEY